MQDQCVGDVINQVQVGQCLVGYLVECFVGDQRLYVVMFSYFRCGMYYYMFEDNVYLIVVDFFENFFDDWFEINSDKMYVVGAVKVVLQIMCYLMYVNFMCCVVEVKEAVMYAAVVMY